MQGIRNSGCNTPLIFRLNGGIERGSWNTLLQCLCVEAKRFSQAGIPDHERGIVIPHPCSGDSACVQCKLKPKTGLIDFRQITPRRQKPLDVSVFSENRRDGHIPEAAVSPHGIGIPLKASRLSTQGRLNRLHGHDTSLTSPQINPGNTVQDNRAVELHGLDTTCVDEPDAPVQIEDMNAVRRAGQKKMGKGFTGPERFSHHGSI